MSHDKIGPRELALRKMREAKFGKREPLDVSQVKSVVEALQGKVAVAAKKTGKSMKRRKK